eukprot:SAG11_NODE_851_length_6875_cov_8.193034_5_plen_136_part_00
MQKELLGHRKRWLGEEVALASRDHRAAHEHVGVQPFVGAPQRQRRIAATSHCSNVALQQRRIAATSHCSNVALQHHRHRQTSMSTPHLHFPGCERGGCGSSCITRNRGLSEVRETHHRVRAARSSAASYGLLWYG